MRPVLFALALLSFALPARAENPVVRFTTPVGAFDLELCQETSAVCDRAAPNTVANFLGYLDDGDYANSIVHRSVTNFVIQGGSYRLEEGVVRSIVTPEDDPVMNEFTGFTNRRGTVSVPLQGDGPSACDTLENSGTSGWFVNVGQNTGLDCGLFTVFGVVLGDGMQVVDAIGALERVNYNSACLDPIFDPIAIAAAFGMAPVTDAFWAVLQEALETATGCGDLPPPSDFANALIRVEVTRAPEPGSLASGILAALSLSGLARRRRIA